MTDARRILRAASLAAALALPPGAVLAQAAVPATPPAPAARPADRPFTLGYVELRDDPRYADDGSFAGISFRTFGRPKPGAALALADAKAIGRATHVDYRMVEASAADAAAIVEAIKGWERDADVHFVLADLPAAALLDVSRGLGDDPVTLLNLSARDDGLRGADCRADVLHVAPSDAMLSDALVEFLVSRKWRKLAALQGPSAEDARAVEALRRSARKFGASLVDVKRFALTNDPRDRDSSDVALLTAGLDYDALYVADSSNEFGRYVPFRTNLPRLVVGSAGLTATPWTWSWDRDGAAQLQHRFERLAMPRRMNAGAYSAWAAARAVVQASLKAGSTGRDAVLGTLLGPDLTLDSVKGTPASFRPWDHQMRQPLLLATADAVIATAPLPEFLHQSDALDTLGVDRPESRCGLKDAR